MKFFSKNNTDKKRGPIYFEDETKYDGKVSFCNIEAVPRYGFQQFEKVKGSVKYIPSEGLMKEKDNIIKNYKNIKIELLKLDEREAYLKELFQQIQNKKSEVKETCSHPLWVYFGRSYYNFESRNTHIAKCICCGQGKFFKAETNELSNFLKKKKVLRLTEFIDPVENFLIPCSTWYEETFEEIRAIVDEVVFTKEEMDVNELKTLVKEHFKKANEETIQKLEKTSRKKGV